MADTQGERIETYSAQRFKLIGGHIVAVEQTCFHCHQTYWQSVITFSPDANAMIRAHQCIPARQGGASVINKFG